MQLLEVHPKHGQGYDELVRGEVMARNRKTGELVQAWAGGFPGSAAHALMFTRLKERGLETVPYLVGISGSRTERVVFIAGPAPPRIQAPRHRAPFRGAAHRALVLPIAVWHKGDLRAYRSWQRDLYTSALERWTASPTTSAHPDQLGLFEVPSNPVAKVLGMSGECGCLSYAVPGEVEQWRTAYPDDPFILRMAALEEELRDRPRHSRPPQAVGLEQGDPEALAAEEKYLAERKRRGQEEALPSFEPHAICGVNCGPDTDLRPHGPPVPDGGRRGMSARTEVETLLAGYTLTPTTRDGLRDALLRLLGRHGIETTCDHPDWTPALRCTSCGEPMTDRQTQETRHA